ncbi:MAG: DNA-formamidopyrimidine glycosylase family protein [Dermatophilaceae bacterium]
MPEGDTVYRLARRLDARLQGAVVTRSELRVPRHAGADLAGRRLLGHDTHGKHLLTRFDGGLTLHTHLRMQGEWTVTRPGRRLPRRLDHEIRVLLTVVGGETAHGLRLPVVDLVRTGDERLVIGHLGPDPLRADWDAGEAARRFGRAPGRALVSALLDQRVLAGLGNLWANELCFLLGRSPWTPAGEVPPAEAVELAARCLHRSATVDGAYQVTTGDLRRGERHWVVGRAGRPCPRCGTIVRVVAELPGDPGNRRTWWCPRCQPGPGPQARHPPRLRDPALWSAPAVSGHRSTPSG